MIGRRTEGSTENEKQGPRVDKVKRLDAKCYPSGEQRGERTWGKDGCFEELNARQPEV